MVPVDVGGGVVSCVWVDPPLAGVAVVGVQFFLDEQRAELAAESVVMVVLCEGVAGLLEAGATEFVGVELVGGVAEVGLDAVGEPDLCDERDLVRVEGAGLADGQAAEGGVAAGPGAGAEDEDFDGLSGVVVHDAVQARKAVGRHGAASGHGVLWQAKPACLQVGLHNAGYRASLLLLVAGRSGLRRFRVARSSLRISAAAAPSSRWVSWQIRRRPSLTSVLGWLARPPTSPTRWRRASSLC